jgi:type II secretory ATPase GspE/PulE/Tfp pilus assembly ATPase PilB-like protein
MSDLSSETVMLKQQPWHVASWRPVTLALTQRPPIIRRLAPCDSGRLQGQRLERGTRGQVMWACDTALGPVGLAWDWFALRPAVLAMADPMGVLTISAARAVTGLKIRTELGLEQEIADALDKYYGEGEKEEIETGRDEESAADLEHLRDMASEAPVIRLVNAMIAQAVEKRASDIHI